MKKVILLSLVAIGIFASCRKETTSSMSTTDMVQKKWRLVSTQDVQYVGTTNVVDTIITTPAAITDSIEFKTNNTAVFTFMGFADTVNYQIIGDTKIVVDADTFTINTLNLNDFVMTYSNRVDTPHYDIIVTLKR
jgi:nucleoside-specific outer membrane channel protein Tsx